MTLRIQKTVVLGAGTMGARIAAHFANAGLPCLLLDIVPKDAAAADRNKIVLAGFDAAKKSKPAAFFRPRWPPKFLSAILKTICRASPMPTGSSKSSPKILKSSAICLAKVAQFRKPGSIVTTNTSGLPVHLIAEGLPEEFQQHWAGTHFFNPPRYMKLVEVIPGPKTSARSARRPCRFLRSPPRQRRGDRQRHAEFHRQSHRHIFHAERAAPDATLGMTIEEVDACTGPAVGWPKSATFRTADIVGLDVLVHVVKNIYETAPNDESREIYKVPALVEEMATAQMAGR